MRSLILNTTPNVTQPLFIGTLGNIEIPVHPASVNLANYGLKVEEVLRDPDIINEVSNGIITLLIDNHLVIDTNNINDPFILGGDAVQKNSIGREYFYDPVSGFYLTKQPFFDGFGRNGNGGNNQPMKRFNGADLNAANGTYYGFRRMIVEIAFSASTTSGTPLLEFASSNLGGGGNQDVLFTADMDGALFFNSSTNNPDLRLFVGFDRRLFITVRGGGGVNMANVQGLICYRRIITP